MRPYRLLVDVGHPAHVHLFRNLVRRVEEEGGQAVVAARDKDVTLDLCRGYGLPFVSVSRPWRWGVLGMIGELCVRTARILALARRLRAHALVGTSASVGLVGRLLGQPSFVFNEDDSSVAPLFAAASYPLARFVVTPACLAHERLGRGHVTYQGYHELAYLHPTRFSPDPSKLDRLGLDPGRPHFVLRLVALRAHHDARERGIPLDVIRDLLRFLEARGRVLITSEGALLPEFERHRFPLAAADLHDVLATAALYVGDSQTMAAEAAVLGVPGVRCNSFVGRISYLEELEHRYGLTVGLPPDRAVELLPTVEAWLSDTGTRRQWAERRQRMLSECVDLTAWQWDLLQERAPSLT